MLSVKSSNNVSIGSDATNFSNISPLINVLDEPKNEQL